MLKYNDVLLLNDIIYKVYTMDNLDQMRRSTLDSLKLLIPSSISTFYLAHPEHPMELYHPVGLGLPDTSWEQYLREFQPHDYTRWTFSTPVPNAWRETDFMNDAERENTIFYKKMYAPANIHYVAILTLIYHQQFYGCISLYRPKQEADFSDNEMRLLGMLKEHLSYRLAAEAALPPEKAAPSSISDLGKQYRLTPREIEIVQLLLHGEERSAICQQLSISPNTLKKHTSNIYRKCQVSSWRELYHTLLQNKSQQI